MKSRPALLAAILVCALTVVPAWAVPFAPYIDSLTKRCFDYTSDAERIRICSALLRLSAGHVPDYRSGLYFARADAYMHSGDWDHALGDIASSLNEMGTVPNPFQVFVISRRGEIYLKMGKSDLGRDDLTKVIATLSDEIPHMIEEVRHHVEKFALLQDDLNGRAWARHLLGEDAAGLVDVTNALVIYDKSANVLETRAEIYEKLGKREDALADYRTALALRPNFAEAEDGIARLGQAGTPVP